MKDLQQYALANPLERADGKQDMRNMRALSGGWQIKLTANY